MLSPASGTTKKDFSYKVKKNLRGRLSKNYNFSCFWRKRPEKIGSFLVFLGFLLVFGQTVGHSKDNKKQIILSSTTSPNAQKQILTPNPLCIPHPNNNLQNQKELYIHTNPIHINP
ncbi:MAG: hypothetical protein LBQ98_07170 [Nitrososphaerota archaeon]|nr:hypothetical protein [Nitrososphaerota archaeon]